MALLFAVAGMILCLRKKRNSFQRAKPTTASGTVREPHNTQPNILEMHEDARPVELSEQTLQELHGQSLPEMDQPRSRMELPAYEPPVIQINRDYD